MGPYAPEVYRAPYPDAYRGPDAAEALARLEQMLDTYVPAEHVAAIVIEPQLGEGGFVPASREYMQGLRALCDRHGIVLVADEVQTGFGRTGRMFAMEHFGVEPDLMTVAKSIAAGIPLSGVVGRAHVMDAPGDSAVGGTYVGNPVAIAAAHAVLDTIAEDRLADRAMEVGETIRSRMESWRERFDSVADVRGLGAMLAIELRQNGEPAADLATAVADAAARRGLLILKAGIHGNCIRVLVPLVIGDSELDEALGAWEEALEEASA
jgi:4-aminobutyrate aminotransferase/(S)-3-amino-2-methylpropionate transaminase